MKELLRDYTITIIDKNKKRVDLYYFDNEGDKKIVATVHPKHADDIIKVYNRNADRYDWLY